MTWIQVRIEIEHLYRIVQNLYLSYLTFLEFSRSSSLAKTKALSYLHPTKSKLRIQLSVTTISQNVRVKNELRYKKDLFCD